MIEEIKAKLRKTRDEFSNYSLRDGLVFTEAIIMVTPIIEKLIEQRNITLQLGEFERDFPDMLADYNKELAEILKEQK